MAIALRHNYNVASELANGEEQFYFPDAIKARIDLARQTGAATRSDQESIASSTQAVKTEELPGDVKPLWIGNPNQQTRRVSFQPLQEWEGYVIEITDEVFIARLVDRTAKQLIEEEIAEFPMAELSEDDKQLLRPGAVFRWVIGYERAIGGQRRRVSQVVFRRMPAWSKSDLQRAKDRASDLIENIDWE